MEEDFEKLNSQGEPDMAMEDGPEIVSPPRIDIPLRSVRGHRIRTLQEELLWVKEDEKRRLEKKKEPENT